MRDFPRPTRDGGLEVSSKTVNSTQTYEPDLLVLFTWQTEAFNRAIQRDEEPMASGVDGLKVSRSRWL